MKKINAQKAKDIKWHYLGAIGIIIFILSVAWSLRCITILGKFIRGELSQHEAMSETVFVLTLGVPVILIGFAMHNWAEIKLGKKPFPIDTVRILPDEDHPKPITVVADTTDDPTSKKGCHNTL